MGIMKVASGGADNQPAMSLTTSAGTTTLIKLRNQLSASDLETLYCALEQKLDRIGIETQPEVACRILDLSGKVDAQITDYAKIIRADVGLSGRLLRLANSAFFAQRAAVTSLDRACVLMGIERLRAFSLGFYLSRAAAGDAMHEASRRIWGESVFRACLSLTLARKLIPEYTMEAFAIGLMMDAGLPLMVKMGGQPFMKLDSEGGAPPKRHYREYMNLPFTHVDLIVSLARKWKLPPLLAKPLAWHHTPPGETTRTEPEHVLHRIAYYAGAVELDTKTRLPKEAAPMQALAAKVVGFGEKDLTSAISTASAEYKASMTVFSGVATSISDLDDLPSVVHAQLSRIIDDTISRAAPVSPEKTTDAGPQVFRLGGCDVEVVRDEPGLVTCFLLDSGKQRISSHRFAPSGQVVNQVRSAFCLDPVADDETDALAGHIKAIAA